MKILEKGEWLTLLENENGNLVIHKSKGIKREIKNLRDDGFDSDSILRELLEDIMGDSGWRFLQPEDIDALTSAPILGSEVVYSDDGEIKSTGEVYWFPDYQVIDPIDELYEKGEVVFDKAESTDKPEVESYVNPN